MKNSFLYLFIKLSMFASLLFISAIFSASSEEIIDEFNDAELAQMLAPIALYPDSLLTHILISSTYPLEVIEAERWITHNEDLSTNDTFLQIEDKDWDPSIKALIAFPVILKRLSDDLTWTRQLGEAFLQAENRVLEVIQTLRRQAKQAGSLKQIDKMEISEVGNDIIIQPTQQNVVYVPYYDTRTVYGYWGWQHYPPLYWRYQPVQFGHYSHTHFSPFYWHSGVSISVNYFFSAFNWHNRHIIVIDHHNTRHYRQRTHIVSEGYAQHWQHKPYHRKGVAYQNEQVKRRYSNNHSFTKVQNNDQNSHEVMTSKKTNKKMKQVAKSINTNKNGEYAVNVSKSESFKHQLANEVNHGSSVKVKDDKAKFNRKPETSHFQNKKEKVNDLAHTNKKALSPVKSSGKKEINHKSANDVMNITSSHKNKEKSNNISNKSMSNKSMSNKSKVESTKSSQQKSQDRQKD